MGDSENKVAEIRRMVELHDNDEQPTVEIGHKYGVIEYSVKTANKQSIMLAKILLSELDKMKVEHAKEVTKLELRLSSSRQLVENERENAYYWNSEHTKETERADRLEQEIEQIREDHHQAAADQNAREQKMIKGLKSIRKMCEKTQAYRTEAYVYRVANDLLKEIGVT